MFVEDLSVCQPVLRKEYYLFLAFAKSIFIFKPRRLTRYCLTGQRSNYM
ncbi:hypothetical protein VIBHAR_02461 [Vibrio campbellii ATCC BAA-1116]|uniref:Uncharacterized protein n=1 Tax=Vibrio campbellii (strain ATCC BAA-1116) TaxID=2902295 RepID=A7MVX7_VIBC1|nr:hypothetical protein VIBHAR_02461 [Vibrio campbellii ATCC BAA-1116]